MTKRRHRPATTSTSKLAEMRARLERNEAEFNALYAKREELLARDLHGALDTHRDEIVALEGRIAELADARTHLERAIAKKAL